MAFFPDSGTGTADLSSRAKRHLSLSASTPGALLMQSRTVDACSYYTLYSFPSRYTMVTRQWRWSQPLRMLWSNVACLYSLDTLDARFSPAAVAPATAAAVSASASPAQWETREFWVYYVSFVMVVPFMFKAVIDVSQCECRCAPPPP